uniref:Phosphoinositide phosphatase SAC2-like isoform X3 n=1 Tax=Rhizophora mucronata TaxID=61149 RepID=A0A2P2MCM4_RHIMU
MRCCFPLTSLLRKYLFNANMVEASNISTLNLSTEALMKKEDSCPGSLLVLGSNKLHPQMYYIASPISYSST